MSWERLQDAPHRPEQADERRERADRSEHPQPAPHLGDRLAARGREHGVQILERDVPPAQSLEKKTPASGVFADSHSDRAVSRSCFTTASMTARRERATAAVETAQPQELLMTTATAMTEHAAERVDGEPTLVQEVEDCRRVESGARGRGGCVHGCLRGWVQGRSFIFRGARRLSDRSRARRLRGTTAR